jgi:ribosomal-protein-alanine N-acetyltransferase
MEIMELTNTNLEDLTIETEKVRQFSFHASSFILLSESSILIYNPGMPLPILNSPSYASPEALHRLFLKTEHHWTQHYADEEQLSCGSAFCNAELNKIMHANCVLDAALADDTTLEQALAEVEQYFAARGAQCLLWRTNPSAPTERVAPLVDRLEKLGYLRRVQDIMYLRHMPTSPVLEVPNLKIIPARASFKAARELAEEIADEWREPQLAEANMVHLDDPHWDALIALRDGKAVGKIGVLAVGEIGRVQHVYVSPAHRRKGIGRTMMSRALEICARSLFKHVFLSCRGDNAAAIALYSQLGFQKIGEATQYQRRSG